MVTFGKSPVRILLACALLSRGLATAKQYSINVEHTLGGSGFSSAGQISGELVLGVSDRLTWAAD